MFGFEKRKVQRALEEYRKLYEYGCLQISCEKCKYIYKASSSRYSCKREELMAILWSKHREKVLKIEEDVRKSKERKG